MKAFAMTALAALLVACGGSDNEDAPVPVEPTTRPVPKPLVEGPFWPPMFEEKLPASYLDPAPNEAKFRRLIGPSSRDFYYFRDGSNSDIVGQPCSFDPVGLPDGDPMRPAKATFGDKVFYDPTIVYSSDVVVHRRLVQPQFSPGGMELSSYSGGHSMTIGLAYTGPGTAEYPATPDYDGASAPWYSTSVEVRDGSAVYRCTPKMPS